MSVRAGANGAADDAAASEPTPVRQIDFLKIPTPGAEDDGARAAADDAPLIDDDGRGPSADVSPMLAPTLVNPGDDDDDDGDDAAPTTAPTTSRSRA